MKRSMTLTLIVIATIIALTSGIGEKTHAGGTGGQPRRIAVKTISSRIPVTVGSPTASPTDDNQTAMKVTVTNNTGGRLLSLGLVALIVDKSGAIRGGEGWKADADLAPNASQDFLHVLKPPVGPEDHLLLTVWRASGTGGTFEIDPKELNDVLRAPASSPKLEARREGRLSGARNVKASLRQSNTYCQGWYAFAESKCACGVKSFSCDEKNGTFSWTCFTKSESNSCRPPIQNLKTSRKRRAGTRF